MNIHHYRNLASIFLVLVIIYTVFVLYNIRFKLHNIVSSRLGNNEFMVAIIMFIMLFVIYGILKKQMNNIDIEELEGPDHQVYDDMKKKLDIFRSALLNGLIAIFISILALADTFMPGFFVTVVVYYYASIFL